MLYLFLASFVVGLLLAVRLMLFGAERRHARKTDGLLLRRSEPAIIAFLLMFGILGYLVVRRSSLSLPIGVMIAAAIAVVFAAITTRLAIATARIQPEHDPEDPRFLLQGRVGFVTIAIPVGQEGAIRYEDGTGAFITLPARDIGNGAIGAGEEVCIERVENGVAHVELWALVEERL